MKSRRKSRENREIIMKIMKEIIRIITTTKIIIENNKVSRKYQKEEKKIESYRNEINIWQSEAGNIIMAIERE